MNKFLSGKTVLLTGAGGSIGSAIAKTMGSLDAKFLVLLDHSEASLSDLELSLNDIQGLPPHAFVVGDICDLGLVAEVLERYRPEVVYHAAAFKQVPLMEKNPIAAARNNAVGTYNLARAAQMGAVETFTMVSTDKAVNPRSIMGASKRVAELALLRLGGSLCRMRAVRLGNVLWSRGSVLPRFERQISTGQPVTVTHPMASRYCLTLQEAVNAILLVSALPVGGGVFIPRLGEPVAVLDLAHRLIEETVASNQEILIHFTGLRPGDKLTEDLISGRESLAPIRDSPFFRVNGAEMQEDQFDATMDQLTECVERRDLVGVLEAIEAMVPEYLPSDSLLAMTEKPLA